MATILVRDLKILERLIKPLRVYNRSSFRILKAFSIDSRSITKGEGFIALKGKLCDGHEFIEEAVANGAACIIAQKYVATKQQVPFLVVKDSYKALSAIVRLIRDKKKPFVYAITGSIGKTTTKEMLYFLLKDHCRVLKNKKTENNILGVAKTILSLKDQDVVIAELGTNQKGEISTLSSMLAPNVGVITFIKPVHLEGLGSLRGILKEKLSLLSGNPKMKLVLNHDDMYLRRVKSTKNIYWFGSKDNLDLSAACKNRDSQSSHFLIQDSFKLSLPRYREGFITDILAAVLAAHLYRIPIAKLVSKISKFKDFPSMRMQIQKLNRLLILNDAYNANPYSVKVGLKSLKDHPLRKIVVIGDMLELGKKSAYYHRLLAPQIIENNFDYCLMLGRHTQHLKKSLSELGYRRAFHFLSHKDLAEFISKKINLKQNRNQGYLVFLKGSRRMELEKVVSYLR
ncbi:MAG: UDP-N-acetylmuramoyl-tripeptide--D-alanyl-D-alanine ligase [Candidatus Omnitrophica bacterium]|nr:UDP-N-acetylmuramoyl-tripeptide--D-alanyl-D-alanine ligase [Candidatus Omnitrophota bacterium]